MFQVKCHHSYRQNCYRTYETTYRVETVSGDKKKKQEKTTGNFFGANLGKSKLLASKKGCPLHDREAGTVILVGEGGGALASRSPIAQFPCFLLGNFFPPVSGSALDYSTCECV